MSTEQEPSLSKPILVTSFENESVERPFLDEIGKSYNELRKLIPTLPEQLKVTFGTNYDYGEDGVTGSAVAMDEIKVGIDKSIQDRSKQYARIRSLVFHEGYHIAQGFHLGTQFSALESAIYEGCATLFERNYAGSLPKWGDYSKENEATLQRWFNEMKTISAEQYFEPSGETWRKWAFFDSETGESWRIYKVGTWLVENILRKNDADILDFSSKTARELLRYLEYAT